MTRSCNRFAVFGMAMAAALWLSGCGGLLGIAPPQALDAFELRAPAPGGQASRRLARSLVVEMPGGSGAVRTDRILIRPSPLQAAYLPGARWTDEAPMMIQGLMVRAIEDTGALRHVGQRALPGGIADFTLVSDLTDFQAEVKPDRGVQVRVRLSARMVRDADGQVLAVRSFEATAPAGSTATSALVAAFDDATVAVLRQLTPWALGSIGVRLAGS